MNSRGRRVVERALSRHIRKQQRQIAEKLRRDFLHQRKIKNAEESRPEQRIQGDLELRRVDRPQEL